MPLFMINDDDFRSKLSEQTLNVDCVVVEAYEDCRLPFCEFILPDLIGNRYKSRLPLGELKVGDVKEIKPCRGAVVKHVLGAIVPGNYNVFNEKENFDILKRCCLNVLRHAHKHKSAAGKPDIKSIALPPFYAEHGLFNGDVSFAAAVDAADKFLSENDNSLDIYVITNSKQEEKRPFFLKGMTLDHSTNYILSGKQESERVDFSDKALRLLRKWGSQKSKPDYSRQRLPKIVRDSGLRDAEISRRSGVSPSTISRIMSGKIEKPEIENAIAIAIALDLSAEERDEFIGCAGHNYSHYKWHDAIEGILKEKGNNVAYVNSELFRKYQFVLTGKKDEVEAEAPEKTADKNRT